MAKATRADPLGLAGIFADARWGEVKQDPVRHAGGAERLFEFYVKQDPRRAAYFNQQEPEKQAELQEAFQDKLRRYYPEEFRVPVEPERSGASVGSVGALNPQTMGMNTARVERTRPLFDPGTEKLIQERGWQGTTRSLGNMAMRGATSEGLYMAGEGVARGLAGLTETIAGLPGYFQEQGLREIERMEPETGAQLRREMEMRQGGKRRQPNPLAKDLLWYADAARELREDLRERLPADAPTEHSIGGQVAQGVGQMAAMLPLYSIPGVGPTATVGQLYQEGYDDYVRTMESKGQPIDPEAAHMAGLGNAPAAALEYLGDKLIIGRVLKPLKGKVTVGDLVKGTFFNAATEGVTEGMQQFWQNVVATTLMHYDPGRKLDDAVIQSVIVGGLVGGIVGGTGSAAAAAMQPEHSEAEPDRMRADEEPEAVQWAYVQRDVDRMMENQPSRGELAFQQAYEAWLRQGPQLPQRETEPEIGALPGRTHRGGVNLEGLEQRSQREKLKAGPGMKIGAPAWLQENLNSTTSKPKKAEPSEVEFFPEDLGLEVEPGTVSAVDRARREYERAVKELEAFQDFENNPINDIDVWEQRLAQLEHDEVELRRALEQAEEEEIRRLTGQPAASPEVEAKRLLREGLWDRQNQGQGGEPYYLYRDELIAGRYLPRLSGERYWLNRIGHNEDLEDALKATGLPKERWVQLLREEFDLADPMSSPSRCQEKSWSRQLIGIFSGNLWHGRIFGRICRIWAGIATTRKGHRMRCCVRRWGTRWGSKAAELLSMGAGSNIRAGKTRW
jgi:hypothetical protein